MDRATLAAARIERFLETEPVVWLSTTAADGAPHLVPTWFAWDGATIIIRSKPGAHKVRNLRADPRAMLALGDAEDDFDVGLVEAVAESAPAAAGSDAAGQGDLPVPFLDKYADRIAGLGLTPAQFARTYSETIRLRPRRALGWHGRSRPASILEASRRVSTVHPLSITEPSTGARLAGGEPIARRARTLTHGERHAVGARSPAPEPFRRPRPAGRTWRMVGAAWARRTGVAALFALARPRLSAGPELPAGRSLPAGPSLPSVTAAAMSAP